MIRCSFSLGSYSCAVPRTAKADYWITTFFLMLLDHQLRCGHLSPHKKVSANKQYCVIGTAFIALNVCELRIANFISFVPFFRYIGSGCNFLTAISKHRGPRSEIISVFLSFLYAFYFLWSAKNRCKFCFKLVFLVFMLEDN